MNFIYIKGFERTGSQVCIVGNTVYLCVSYTGKTEGAKL